MPYHSMDWNGTRNIVAKEDLFYPHPFFQVMIPPLGHCTQRAFGGRWL